ncbi:MAG: molybdopterin converting factor subunit 1 [Cellvibrionales bacterium]|jgi:molybdopterin synthase sulfur carrier subunit|nr:molybdopterin converting factor subunit 1 [Cellvibrionales bacterium]
MIKCVFFARLREQLGVSEHRVALGGNVTVEGLIDHLIASDSDNDHWRLLLADDIVVAKNQQVVDRDTSIEEGDELAFFPPVTGG